MKPKSRLFLLIILPILVSIMITVVNATAEANADANADANNTIQPYNDPPIVHGCGQVHIKKKKIIGGHEAAFGSHPWHGALYVKAYFVWQYYCGSSLLNNRWVVTAASCMYLKGSRKLLSNDNLRIRLGEWKIYTSGRFAPQEFGVEKIEIYPQYSYPRDEFHLNIAMLKLNDTVSFKQYIVPICLPMSNLNIFDQIFATFVGWGKIDAKHMPNVLQEIDVEIINIEKCEKWYGHAAAVNRFANDAICAGYKEGGRVPCLYDLGGGLTTIVGGKHVLIGVNSVGHECAMPKLPGVYTYVQKYVPWIVNIMK